MSSSSAGIQTFAASRVRVKLVAREEHAYGDEGFFVHGVKRSIDTGDSQLKGARAANRLDIAERIAIRPGRDGSGDGRSRRGALRLKYPRTGHRVGAIPGAR